MSKATGSIPKKKSLFTKAAHWSLFLLLPGLLFFGACKYLRFHDSKSDPKLIGGRTAEEGQFPWIVTFDSSCTAAKVGRKAFLLAGHCLQQFGDKTIRSHWLPGMQISISNKVSPKDDDFVRYTIEKVHINDDWFLGRNALSDTSSLGTADAAVLHVREESPSIPQAEISFDTVTPGADVTMAGYGCEGSLRDRDKDFDPKLKFHRTRLAGIEVLNHLGSWVKNPQDVFDRFYLTPGQDYAPNEASLCPGDSGGPLFLTESRKVIGVNANYTFLPNGRDVAYSNHFTRLDVEARPSLAAWLKQALEGTAPVTTGYPESQRLTQAHLLSDTDGWVEMDVPPVGKEVVFWLNIFPEERMGVDVELAPASGIGFMVTGLSNLRNGTEVKSQSEKSTVISLGSFYDPLSLALVKNEGAQDTFKIRIVRTKKVPIGARCIAGTEKTSRCVDYNHDIEPHRKECSEERKWKYEAAKACAFEPATVGFRWVSNLSVVTSWRPDLTEKDADKSPEIKFGRLRKVRFGTENPP